jgi:transcriptional regulator with XRE-family HTH domain
MEEARELSAIARWLVAECEARDLSWAEASRRAGVDKGTISAIVRGHQPGLETCKAFAAFFETPLEDVLRLAGHLPAESPTELPPEVLVLVREMERLPQPIQRAALRAWRAVLDGFTDRA